MVGDIADSEKCVAIPLCPDCGQLPQMLKWSRVLKMLRAIQGQDRYGVQRISRLIQFRSVISFPVNQQVIAAEAALMSDQEERYTRDLQSKLPAGSTIWAWLDAPFHLDFGRNRIWHFNHAWFIAPWSLHVRYAEELRQELVVRNVDYILWQHQSYFAPSLPALRRQLQGDGWAELRVIHQNTIDLLLALANTPFETVYADDRTVLLSLRPPSQARPPSQETDHTLRSIER